MKNILTYGTFDLFHYGHARILTRAREAGRKLHVGVSTDRFNTTKGKKSWNSFSIRSNDVLLHVPDAHVFPEVSFEQKVFDIKAFDIDMLVMGDDWKGKFDWLKDLCEVVYLPRTPGVSTTLLKSLMGEGKYHSALK